MFASSEIITANKDFSERFVKNFVEQIKNIRPLVYIETTNKDRRVNAKSVLGILSLQIKKGDEYKFVLMQPDIAPKDEVNQVLEIFRNV